LDINTRRYYYISNPSMFMHCHIISKEELTLHPQESQLHQSGFCTLTTDEIINISNDNHTSDFHLFFVGLIGKIVLFWFASIVFKTTIR
jgi:hypothetical protein